MANITELVAVPTCVMFRGRWACPFMKRTRTYYVPESLLAALDYVDSLIS
jgi:hypothetical protein